MDKLATLQLAVIFSSCAVILYYFSILCYRYAFHPLRSYGGPSLAHLTNAYGGFQALHGRSHLDTYENHLKYGSVFRQGPNKLVFNTIAALQDIYHNPVATKSDAYVLGRQTPLGNVWDTIEIDMHRRKRRIISQPISEKSIKKFEPILADQVRICIQQLLIACRQSKPVNMTKQFEYLSSDIVGHLAFGYPLRMQTEDTNRSLLSAVPFGGKRANIYMQFPRSAVIEPLLRLVGRAAGNKYRAIISKMIEHRVALSKDALHDLYSFAADSKLDGKGMEGDELWAEAFFFIVAGGATTATTMSSLCFYLVRYPECYKKLSQEIRSQFQSGEEIRSGHQLQGCSYLRACIDEALRMSPPSSGMLWRKQAPSKTGEKPNNASFIVDGHVIPYGTEVTVNTYALHHNEAYFPDSFAFRPERWLTPEGKDPSSLIRKAFVPFSMGTRSCVGKALAYLEISLALANISYYFDFEQAPGNQGQVGGGVKGRRDGREREDEFQLYDILTALHDGPVLMFKERKAVRGDL